MAPGNPTPPIDLRAQVIENCEFFSGPYAHISLVVAKEPLGSFKAIVLRTEDGVRDALLSETASSFSEALQALYVKSAEAVQNYIGTNGFALVSAIRMRNSKHVGSHDDGDDSDSASSTVTLDDCESLSDNETISVTSVGRAKRSRRNAGKSARTSAVSHKPRQSRARSRSRSFSPARARSRSTCSSSSESELHYDPPTMPSRRAPFLHAFAQRMPPRPPQTTFPAFTMGPPPPPPPPPGPPGGISTAPRYSPPTTTTTTNLPMPIPPPPPPFSFNKAPPPPPAPRTTTTITPTSTPTSLNNPLIVPNTTTPTSPTLHDIVLHIRWRHHGERRALEQTPNLSVRNIQQAALAFVRRQAASFANVPLLEGNNHVAHVAHRAVLVGLKAAVKSVVVEGVVYDLGGYAGEGDLTRLLAGLSSSSPSEGNGKVVPRFEVDVWNVGSGGGSGEGLVSGVVNVGVPVRPASGGVSSGGGGVSGFQGVVGGHGVGGGPRMVFTSPAGVLSN